MPMPVVFVVLIVVGIFCLLPLRHRSFLAVCEEVVNVLPSNQYEKLCELVDRNPARMDESRFWALSYGLTGQLDRVRTSWAYLRLVQAHYRDRRIDRQDAASIWQKLILQCWFSVLAIPEAALCSLFGQLPHVAARQSLKFYCDIVIGSQSLCLNENAPKCLLDLNDLL